MNINSTFTQCKFVNLYSGTSVFERPWARIIQCLNRISRVNFDSVLGQIPPLEPLIRTSRALCGSAAGEVSVGGWVTATTLPATTRTSPTRISSSQKLVPFGRANIASELEHFSVRTAYWNRLSSNTEVPLYIIGIYYNIFICLQKLDW